MYLNNIKISARNLAKNRAYTSINIFGLALGLATCLLIILYVSDELRVDRHHHDGDRIYRVALETKSEKWAAMPGPVAQALKADFPEVEESARVLRMTGMDPMILDYRQPGQEKKFYETGGMYVDSTFFRILTYDFKYGHAASAMSRPNSMVLSETLANRIFGNIDPQGKQVRVGLPFGHFDYTVTGVFREKEQSHINASFFLSMQNTDLGPWVNSQTSWASNNLFHTYFKLAPGTDPAAFEAKLPAFLDRHGRADLQAMGISKKLFLQPLRGIYLHSAMGNELSTPGSMTYLYIFGSIAAFILVIACINFMNLTTAYAGKRAREVGVRKVMGAARSSLISQFLGESLALAVMALLAGTGIVTLLLPVFNKMTGKSLHLLSEPSLLIWMGGITIFTGLLAGIYPAIYLSAFKPIAVLKGRLITGFGAITLRRALVVFQFTISIILLLGAAVILKQLSFIKNRNLGFQKEQQLVIPMRSQEAAGHYQALREQVLQRPDIISVSSGSAYPGIETAEDLLFYTEKQTVADATDIHFATVETDYPETLGLKIIAGRSFSRRFTADSNSIILNEAAVKNLGMTPAEAIGKKIYSEFRNTRYGMQIVGVVQNFHYESLHQEIKPYGLTTTIGDKHIYFIAHIRASDYAPTIAGLENIWKKLNPGTPFSYSFLDQDFQRNYDKEQRTSLIVIYFTLIAVVIACLGLYGLVTFSAEQRTREIGVRKVLGASAASIVALLSRDFLRLVAAAMFIAIPAGWYVMHQWLQEFAYQIVIPWWLFVAVAAGATMVAWLSISFQAVKAALTDPVKSLKQE